MFCAAKNAFCSTKPTCPLLEVVGDCLRSRQLENNQNQTDIKSDNQKPKAGLKPIKERVKVENLCVSLRRPVPFTVATTVDL